MLLYIRIAITWQQSNKSDTDMTMSVITKTRINQKKHYSTNKIKIIRTKFKNIGKEVYRGQEMEI